MEREREEQKKGMKGRESPKCPFHTHHSSQECDIFSPLFLSFFIRPLSECLCFFLFCLSPWFLSLSLSLCLFPRMGEEKMKVDVWKEVKRIINVHSWRSCSCNRKNVSTLTFSLFRSLSLPYFALSPLSLPSYLKSVERSHSSYFQVKLLLGTGTIANDHERRRSPIQFT